MASLPVARLAGSDLAFLPLAAIAAVILAVLAVARRGGSLPAMCIAAAAGYYVIYALHRRPVWALTALPPVVLFGTFAFAGMLRLGVPAPIVRSFGFGKDALVLALAGAALRRSREFRGSRISAVSLIAMTYLGLMTAYLLLPVIDPGATSSNANQAFLGWRYDAYLPGVFLAVSYLSWTESSQRRLESVIISCAVLAALGGIIQNEVPELWRSLVIDVFHVERYQTLVLKVPVTASQLLREGADPTSGQPRAGSVAFEPVYFAFQLLPGWCLSLVRLSRRRSPGPLLALATIGAGIVLSETRSAALCAVIAAVVVSSLVLHRPSLRKAPFVLGLLTLGIPALVFANGAGLTARFSGFIGGRDPSSKSHTHNVSAALDQLRTQPFGTGLGTSSGVSERFTLSRSLIVENAFLKVGVEMGILAFGLLILFLVALMLRLFAGSESHLVLGGATLALVAIVGCYFEDIWTDFGDSVTYASVLGLALSRVLTVGASSPWERTVSPQRDPPSMSNVAPRLGEPRTHTISSPR